MVLIFTGKTRPFPPINWKRKYFAWIFLLRQFLLGEKFGFDMGVNGKQVVNKMLIWNESVCFG